MWQFWSNGLLSTVPRSVSIFHSSSLGSHQCRYKAALLARRIQVALVESIPVGRPLDSPFPELIPLRPS